MPSSPFTELVLSGTVPSWMPLSTFGLTEAEELDSVEFMPLGTKVEEGSSWGSVCSGCEGLVVPGEGGVVLETDGSGPQTLSASLVPSLMTTRF